MKTITAKLRGAMKSATIMVNAAFLAMLPFYDQAIATLPQLQPYLPDDVYKKVGIAVVVINMLLRFRTKAALEQK